MELFYSYHCYILMSTSRGKSGFTCRLLQRFVEHRCAQTIPSPSVSNSSTKCYWLFGLFSVIYLHLEPKHPCVDWKRPSLGFGGKIRWKMWPNHFFWNWQFDAHEISSIWPPSPHICQIWIVATPALIEKKHLPPPNDEWTSTFTFKKQPQLWVYIEFSSQEIWYEL